MNTVLVMMILAQRFWMPVYATQYPTEQACMTEASKYPGAGPMDARKAVCVPSLPRP